MDIYSEYGAIKPEVMGELYSADGKAFTCFLEQFPNTTLTESRILFHEFLMGLQCRFSEDLLLKATKLRLEKRKTK
jgi:hypothetical protein